MNNFRLQIERFVRRALLGVASLIFPAVAGVHWWTSEAVLLTPAIGVVRELAVGKFPLALPVDTVYTALQGAVVHHDGFFFLLPFGAKQF